LTFLINRRLIPTALLAFAFILTGCVSEKPSTLEEQAQNIERLLICPVCPGETIDQSQNELAKQMRAIVQEKVAQGESKDQILQFFVDRYGQGVLAEPSRRGFTLLVWLAPPVAVAIAVVLLVLFIRHALRTRPGYADTSMNEDEDTELKPFLSQVDREAGFSPLRGSESSGRRSESEKRSDG